MNENDNTPNKTDKDSTDKSDISTAADKHRADDILEKLPLLVNGQLDKQESACLETEIQANPELADEHAFLENIRNSLKTHDETLPGAMGLARLKREIEQENDQDKNNQDKEVHAKPNKELKAKGNYWKHFALAACCVLAVQTAFRTNEQVGEADDPHISPLSAGQDSSQAVSKGPKIQLIFSDNATAIQLRTALLAINGTIVDGPGALGIFTIALPKDTEIAEAINKVKEFRFIEEVNAL